MQIQGLKAQLTMTVAVLIFLGMILVGSVVVVLWQRDKVNGFAEQSTLMLQGAGTKILFHAGDSPKNKRMDLDNMIDMKDVLCTKILWTTGREQVTSSCRQEHKLDTVLKKSLKPPRMVAEFFGMSWGTITYTESTLAMAIPIVHEGQVLGSVGVIRSLKPVFVDLRKSIHIILVYLVVNVIILTAIGLFRLVRLVVHPIEKLMRLADTYKDTDGGQFFEGKGTNEFGTLSFSLNRMLGRIRDDNIKLRQTVTSLEETNAELTRHKQEMVRAEKLASVGRLSAGLAHEIGNPLGVVLGYVSMLSQENLSAEERYQFSIRAESELNRIDKLIKQLLDFSRKQSLGNEDVSVHEVLRDVVELLKIEKNTAKITFVEDLSAAHDRVRIDRDNLYQVLLNCLHNSVDAILEANRDDMGEIRVECANVPTENEKKHVVVTISDNGSGIAKDDIENIFDPFFTTKDPGQGTGLGLSVSHSIIENHHGTMSVTSQHGEGTKIAIRLPGYDEDIVHSDSELRDQ